MDFIRAVIKGLFYDFPLEAVGSMVRNADFSHLGNRLGEVLRWKERTFTSSEIEILVDMVNRNWMCYDMSGRPFGNHDAARLFLPLNHFCREVLTDEHDTPRVRFDNLLRWHDLTQYVGEDLFVTSYLAGKDVLRGNVRSEFLWPDVLPHDNYQLNRILAEGLVDLHAHLMATSDVFGFSWLALMNAPSADKFGDTPYQEFDIQLPSAVNSLPLHQWGTLAAAIREGIYRLVEQGQPFEEALLMELLSSRQRNIELSRDVWASVGIHKVDAFRLPDNSAIDYAISKEAVVNLDTEDLQSPYMIHLGERRLLYRYFCMYYSKDIHAITAVPWVYLYHLIKAKFRREFIKTNPLLGLANFQRYERRKWDYTQGKEGAMYQYAVQTSIGKSGANHLEARVSPGTVDRLRFPKGKQELSDTPALPLFDSIFLDTAYIAHEHYPNLTFVIHFIKQSEDAGKGEIRYAMMRKKIESDMNKVIQSLQRNKRAKELGLPLLCGLDAAGNELNCRPELFAPFYRLARAEGMRHFTYHAGEDYYDLIDGMRAIDELMMFMEYSHGCRIGHALALGVNPRKYYESRHYNVIMPKQVLLDNMVWMNHKSRIFDHLLQPSTVEFIQRTTLLLYKEIGYGEDFDEYSYWQSMMLRGDRDDFYSLDDNPQNSNRRLTALCRSKEAEEARRNKKATQLYTEYLRNSEIRRKGNEPCAYHLPKPIHKDVCTLQEAMLCDIEHRGICIECNPSSNLQTGFFDRYDELPLFRFMSIDSSVSNHSLQISINTDDRGVFATSLVNEYSLIAASLYKQTNEESRPRYSADEINQYIKRIIEHSRYMSFK